MTAKNRQVIVSLGQPKSSCFVLMPFNSGSQSLYERVIRPAVEATGLLCVRADEIFSRPQITHDIWKEIRACALLIADLTGKNPNVLYELGLAHAIGKPSIIITRNEEDVPFDLRALRYLYYDTNEPFWGERLRELLRDVCMKVTAEEEFGTVFEGIAQVDLEVMLPACSIENEPVETIDITGIWFSEVHWGPDSVQYWELSLAQTQDKLVGELQIKFHVNNQRRDIVELVVGYIKDHTVEFHGTTAARLDGGDGYYSLDAFEGMLTPDANRIIGTVTDADMPEMRAQTMLIRRQ